VTTPLSYFQALYAADPDPWSFETRWYDTRKHALTAAAPARPRYRSAFEPGCSTGRLTALLAPRCDRLLAMDAVPAAVQTATARLAATPQVTVRQGRVPPWPPGAASPGWPATRRTTSCSRSSPACRRSPSRSPSASTWRDRAQRIGLPPVTAMTAPEM
jgi:nodulation protein S (NodS)